MPLESGKSRGAFEHNVKAEIETGKPQKQAVAIAYSKQRGDADTMIPAPRSDGATTMAGRKMDAEVMDRVIDAAVRVADRAVRYMDSVEERERQDAEDPHEAAQARERARIKEVYGQKNDAEPSEEDMAEARRRHEEAVKANRSSTLTGQLYKVQQERRRDADAATEDQLRERKQRDTDRREAQRTVTDLEARLEARNAEKDGKLEEDLEAARERLASFEGGETVDDDKSRKDAGGVFSRTTPQKFGQLANEARQGKSNAAAGRTFQVYSLTKAGKRGSKPWSYTNNSYFTRQEAEEKVKYWESLNPNTKFEIVG